jgi:hypothetical protein
MSFSKCTSYLVLLVAAALAFAPRLAATGNNDASKTEAAAAGLDTTNSSTSAAAAVQTPATGAKAEAPITYGFDERFRFEGYNNADFNSAKSDRLNQLRMRTRPYVDINFNEYLEGYLRMGWEGIKRTNDASYPSATVNEQASPFMAGELWFDNAYLKLKKFPGWRICRCRPGGSKSSREMAGSSAIPAAWMDHGMHTTTRLTWLTGLRHRIWS